ncbi:MAG: gamma-glutamyl-gamma-aminobutyrate hydrolase family protein [Anaerolineae bacterium]|nr:gamma-glutamyl-gamma-aminobutyrate hydrolase family protein [Thermoflexales bacterium]MDW8408557.1 gamma-glutamyl-gamma-aminobutyrate hydrolase family protein [Anaerolineae bacterium]
MTRPLILIPTPIQDDKRRAFSMGKNYVRSLIDAGALPILAPVTLDERELRALYESAGGVMLAGGADVDPALYGELPHEKTHDIDPDRDRAECLLTQWAVADDKPLFGICRGIQTMNVALGGSLIQDIPSQWPTNLQHNGHYEGASRDQELHTVRVASGSRVAHMLGGREQVGVNSFHHQAVKRLAEGFVVTSRAADDIIEAIEMPDKRFVVGVQWHPEELSHIRPDMLNLFITFVNAVTSG